MVTGQGSCNKLRRNGKQQGKIMSYSIQPSKQLKFQISKNKPVLKCAFQNILSVSQWLSKCNAAGNSDIKIGLLTQISQCF